MSRAQSLSAHSSGSVLRTCQLITDTGTHWPLSRLGGLSWSPAWMTVTGARQSPAGAGLSCTTSLSPGCGGVMCNPRCHLCSVLTGQAAQHSRCKHHTLTPGPGALGPALQLPPSLTQMLSHARQVDTADTARRGHTGVTNKNKKMLHQK